MFGILQSAADKTSSRNQAQPRAMTQRVVPLFETLDDLNNAGATLKRLLDTPWYRQQLRYASYPQSKDAALCMRWQPSHMLRPSENMPQGKWHQGSFWHMPAMIFFQ